MRSAIVERNTKETRIKLSLNLDGSGEGTIDTGIGFFDHMLELLKKHALIDLTVKADGDLRVDYHHTVEDIGIALGDAFKSITATLEEDFKRSTWAGVRSSLCSVR